MPGFASERYVRQSKLSKDHAMPWISAGAPVPSTEDAVLDRARDVRLVACVPGLLRGIQRNSAAVNA